MSEEQRNVSSSCYYGDKTVRSSSSNATNDNEMSGQQPRISVSNNSSGYMLSNLNRSYSSYANTALSGPTSNEQFSLHQDESTGQEGVLSADLRENAHHLGHQQELLGAQYFNPHVSNAIQSYAPQQPAMIPMYPPSLLNSSSLDPLLSTSSGGFIHGDAGSRGNYLSNRGQIMTDMYSPNSRSYLFNEDERSSSLSWSYDQMSNRPLSNPSSSSSYHNSTYTSAVGYSPPPWVPPHYSAPQTLLGMDMTQNHPPIPPGIEQSSVKSYSEKPVLPLRNNNVPRQNRNNDKLEITHAGRNIDNCNVKRENAALNKSGSNRTTTATAPSVTYAPSSRRICPQYTVKSITVNDLRELFEFPLVEAAQRLGMSMTLFKKICRRNSIPNWPYRKINRLVLRMQSLEQCIVGNPGTLPSAVKESYSIQIESIRDEIKRIKEEAVCPTMSESNQSLDSADTTSVNESGNSAVDTSMNSSERDKITQKKRKRFETSYDYKTGWVADCSTCGKVGKYRGHEQGRLFQHSTGTGRYCGYYRINPRRDVDQADPGGYELSPRFNKK